MNIIDPHLHFFNLQQGDYHWLKPENPPFWPDKAEIYRNLNEQHLQLDSDCKLVGFVHIEAGFDNCQPWREIAWLQSHCSLPFRSVAALDLTLSNHQFKQQLQRLTIYPSVVGIRYILDENALQVLTSANAACNLETLAKQQLSFDLQMPLANIAAVSALAKILDKTIDLDIIIDHAGWPPEAKQPTAQDSICQDWLSGLTTLSKYPRCSIKCSGFEMLNRHYRLAWQADIIEQCVDIFGLKRVMLASNFPLCLFKQSYLNAWQQYLELPRYNKDELSQLCQKNAQRIYKF